MTAVGPPEPTISAPFAPPASRLIRRTVSASDAARAHAASVKVRDDMLADGMALVARSWRETPAGIVIDLVFSPRF